MYKQCTCQALINIHIIVRVRFALLLDQNSEHLITDILLIIKPKRGRKPVAKNSAALN